MTKIKWNQATRTNLVKLWLHSDEYEHCNECSFDVFLYVLVESTVITCVVAMVT